MVYLFSTTVVTLMVTSVALSIIGKCTGFIIHMIDRIYFSRCVGMKDDPIMYNAVAIYMQSYIKKIIKENTRVRLSTMYIQVDQGDEEPLKSQAYVPQVGNCVKFSESMINLDGRKKTYDIWIKSLPRSYQSHDDPLVGITGFQIYTSVEYIETLMNRIRTFSKLYHDTTIIPLFERPEFYRGPLSDGSRVRSAASIPRHLPNRTYVPPIIDCVYPFNTTYSCTPDIPFNFPRPVETPAMIPSSSPVVSLIDIPITFQEQRLNPMKMTPSSIEENHSKKD